MNELATEGVELTTTPTEPQTSEQTAEQVVPEGTAAPEELHPYTDVELEDIVKNDTVIDRNRLTPAQAAIHKTFEKGYTPKFQEAARLKKEAEELIASAKQVTPEPYFPDPQKNQIFIDYQKDPQRITGTINSAIAQLRKTPPITEDGLVNPLYSQAMEAIDQWEQVKSDFQFKREQVNNERTASDRIRNEFGDSAKSIEAFAVSIGVDLQNFRNDPLVRQRIKSIYDVAGATESADGKKVKTTPPPRLATQSGGGSNFQTSKDVFDPKLSTDERILLFKQNRSKY